MQFVSLHVLLFLSSLLDLQILLQKPGPSTSIWASARVQIRPKRHRMETVKQITAATFFETANSKRNNYAPVKGTTENLRTPVLRAL